MTASSERWGKERAARRRRERTQRRVLTAAALLVVFGLGVALGEALHDNPKPSGPQTATLTLPPQTVAP